MKVYSYRLSHKNTDRIIVVQGHSMEEACLNFGANVNHYGFLSKEFVKEDGKTSIEEAIGYARAKEIVDGFERSGDWETDHIRLSNKLQKHYYDDVGIYNQNIEEAIEVMVHLAIAKRYPNNDFIVDHNNIMYEIDSSL